MRVWNRFKFQAAIFIMSLIFIFILISCSSRPAVIFIIRDSSTMEFMIPNEIRPMVDALNKAGYRAILSSESGGKIKAGKEQLSIDNKFSEVDVNKYVGLVIPCCASGSMPKPNTESAKKIVKAALDLHLPIAAHYSGIDLLVLSGLPKKTKLARSFMFASADTGPGIVVDNNIVTSGTCPWMARYQNSLAGTEDLMKKFINMLPKPK